jgi:hypothetical protein
MLAGYCVVAHLLHEEHAFVRNVRAPYNTLLGQLHDKKSSYFVSSSRSFDRKTNFVQVTRRYCSKRNCACLIVIVPPWSMIFPMLMARGLHEAPVQYRRKRSGKVSALGRSYRTTRQLGQNEPRTSEPRSLVQSMGPRRLEQPVPKLNRRIGPKLHHRGMVVAGAPISIIYCFRSHCYTVLCGGNKHRPTTYVRVPRPNHARGSCRIRFPKRIYLSFWSGKRESIQN